jgi:hypothetical protein
MYVFTANRVDEAEEHPRNPWLQLPALLACDSIKQKKPAWITATFR